jgi:DNA polymerase III delta subunit
MKYNYKEFIKHIDKVVNNHKIFFFYGENSYYMLETINSVISKLKNTVKEVVYPWEVDVEDVIKMLSTLSLFTQTVVIVLRYFNITKKSFKKQITEFLQLYNGENFLFLLYEEKVFAREKIEPPLNFFFNNCINIDFPMLTQKEIINEFIPKKIDFKLTDQAKELLCEYVHNDLWLLLNEIEKLRYFVPDKKIVSEEDVIKCCSEYEFSEIEQLIDGIINNNVRQNFDVLNNLISDKKINEVQVLASIYRYFRKNFVFKKIPLQKVYRIMKEIQTTDVKLKTLSTDKKHILENCVLKLAQIYSE